MEHTDTPNPQPEQTARRHLSRRGWQRLLWWTGLASLAGVWISMGCVHSPYGQLFWMVGPFVTSMDRILVAGTLASVIAWIACFSLWITRPRSGAVGLSRRIWTVVRITATAITAVVLLLLNGIVLVVMTPDAIQPIHVLSPASPGGCRLVLWREPNSDYGQFTSMFLKVPGSVTLRELPGAVWVNPNVPKKELRLTLTWSGNQGHLVAQERTPPFGTSNPYPHPITCPAR
ncbi:hypothetical protein [Acidipropionibacterium jensenii]|uniref:hypothetical protein n=1 Tax=Acidipropionibacterium jensenii TaxID=1749 RepID=UPI00214B0B0B|nr:hypothetical protein [Acidipropionibacterium jensenii]